MRSKYFNLENVILGCGILMAVIPTKSWAAETRGGLLVEPAVTYEIGNTTTNYPPPFTSSTGRVDGFGIGARLGFHFNESVFLAMDWRFAKPHVRDSINYNANATSTNYGPVLGLEMPDIGLRIWGAMILGGDLDPDSSNNFDVKLQNASGSRLGVGFHLASVSLNLEYQDIEYGRVNLEQIGPFVSTASFSNVESRDKSFIASVSFPMEF